MPCVHKYKHIHSYSTHTAKGGLPRSLYAIRRIQYSRIVIARSWTHLYYWALGLERKNSGYKLKWTLPYNQITYLPVDNEKSESERMGQRKGGEESTVVLESLQSKAALNPPFSFPNHGHIAGHVYVLTYEEEIMTSYIVIHLVNYTTEHFLNTQKESSTKQRLNTRHSLCWIFWCFIRYNIVNTYNITDVSISEKGISLICYCTQYFWGLTQIKAYVNDNSFPLLQMKTQRLRKSPCLAMMFIIWIKEQKWYSSSLLLNFKQLFQTFTEGP